MRCAQRITLHSQRFGITTRMTMYLLSVRLVGILKLIMDPYAQKLARWTSTARPVVMSHPTTAYTSSNSVVIQWDNIGKG